ncbi:MAG: hypothetical protein ROO71_08960 [Balneola sp.]
MALIENAFVKQNFPQWEHYAEEDTVAVDTDAALTNQVSLAEDELAEYVTVTEETITDPIKRHLLHITKYNLFMLKHGDTEFERDPQIVVDYKHTIKMLTDLRDGKRPASPSAPEEAVGSINMSSKTRRFGGGDWFTDTGSDRVSSKKES